MFRIRNLLARARSERPQPFVPRPRRSARAASRVGPARRQPNPKERPSRWGVSDLDLAAVRFDDLTRDRETQADAARTGGEERLEDAFAQLRRNPRTRIRDDEVDRTIRAGGLDGDLAARGDRFRGIREQAKDHL